jgi:hypothetical protein
MLFPGGTRQDTGWLPARNGVDMALAGRLWRRGMTEFSGASAGSGPLIPISHAYKVLCGHTGNRLISMPGSPLLI